MRIAEDYTLFLWKTWQIYKDKEQNVWCIHRNSAEYGQYKQWLKKNTSPQVHTSRSYALTLKTKYRHLLQAGILYLIHFYEKLKMGLFCIIPTAGTFFNAVSGNK